MDFGHLECFKLTSTYVHTQKKLISPFPVHTFPPHWSWQAPTLMEYEVFPSCLAILCSRTAFGSHRAMAARGTRTSPPTPNTLKVQRQLRATLIAPDIQPKPPPEGEEGRGREEEGREERREEGREEVRERGRRRRGKKRGEKEVGEGKEGPVQALIAPDIQPKPIKHIT